VVAAIPARIKFTVTAGVAIGIKQVINFFLERGSTHHARFINLVVDTHFVLFLPLQSSVQVTHCLMFCDNPSHSMCLIDCITVAIKGGKIDVYTDIL